METGEKVDQRMAAQIETDARHAEYDELLLMARYTELNSARRMIEDEMQEIRDRVTDIVLRESELGEKVRINAFELCISRRRKYREYEGEVQVYLSGMHIPTTIQELRSELRKQEQYWKRDELLEEETAVLNCRFVR
jgi:hypothetical protein